MKYTKIIGTGSYFPEKVMTNFDFMKIVDTSDEWIVERTGIHTRHFASKEETTSYMGFKAAEQAIEMAQIPLSEIDGIIFATFTPDYSMPATAAVCANLLGINGAFAVDVNMACSGFLYALHMADGLIKSGKNKTILIVAGEKISAGLDFNDRSTCILFGDGAGALVVTASNEPGVRCSEVHADGNYSDLLSLHAMGTVYLSNMDSMDIKDNMLKMNGRETFKLAVRNMCDVSNSVIEKSGMKQSDVDFLIPHQANMRIIDAVAKRFDIDINKVMINLDRRGNTAAATIPTALDEGIRNGRITTGCNILMTAFGGGMGWAAALVTL